MKVRTFVAVGLAAALTMPAAAQSPGAPAVPQLGPSVGAVAPDFTAPGADKDGVLKSPVTLSSLKGKTVVLAFFPRARTGGCTMQMSQYRDQYATLFDGGKDVVLFGVSNDADTTLAAWAKEANFPFQFISDTDGAISLKYGTMTEANMRQAARDVYVIGPDGKIAYTKKRFSPATPAHYDSLGTAIHGAKKQ